MADRHTDVYRRVQRLIAEEQPVILDGGVATELERIGIKDYRTSDKSHWGIWALYHAPHSVLEVHRRYVDVGCDVISTNTWAIISAQEMEGRTALDQRGRSHWMDVARMGVRLARQAVEEGGRAGQCAVAFSLNGDVSQRSHLGTLELLSRAFESDPPDLILMETISLIRDDLTVPAVEAMLRTGLPVWLSFRRCRHGVCSVYGNHWGGPEGDLFGRSAHEFERMGVGALLMNCLPVDHVPDMLPWLRDFTDMPLGVYPNLGRYLDPGWRFDERVEPEDYALLARHWREEGAQIVGGCCGVTPEHIAAVRERLKGTRPGLRREAAGASGLHPGGAPETRTLNVPRPWTDEQGRTLYPLPFPEIVCDAGVFRPTQGSFLGVSSE